MRELPATILIDGRDAPIVTDFRAVLIWYYAITRTTFLREGDWQRAFLMVRMLCLEPPATQAGMADAIVGLTRFLLCEEEPDNTAKEEETGPCIDFHQDRNRIWAAFRRCYGIDLDTARMHWWEFRALLNELPDDTEIKQVMRLRAEEPKFPGAEASQEQLKQYWDMVRARERYEITWG